MPTRRHLVAAIGGRHSSRANSYGRARRYRRRHEPADIVRNAAKFARHGKAPLADRRCTSRSGDGSCGRLYPGAGRRRTVDDRHADGQYHRAAEVADRMSASASRAVSPAGKKSEPSAAPWRTSDATLMQADELGPPGVLTGGAVIRRYVALNRAAGSSTRMAPSTGANWRPRLREPGTASVSNGLVHPVVIRWKKSCSKRLARNRSEGIGVVEAAILIETGSLRALFRR